MGFKDAYKWTLEHHESSALIVASAFIPYAINEMINTIRYGVEKDDALVAAIKTLSPLLAISAVRVIAFVLQAYTLDSDELKRTRLRHYSQISHLKSKLKASKNPSIKKEKAITVSLGSRGAWLEVKHSTDYTFDEHKQEFERTNDPLLGLFLVTRLFSNKEYDTGLDYLRESLDICKDKKIQPAISAMPSLIIGLLATQLGKLLTPADPRMYLFSAAYSAFFNPVDTWHHSSLGRMVADEFDSPFRKEMYVCHALLASAQGRSDEQEAWNDAVKVSQEGAEWERLGESRSVVRVIKNGTFFRNTFLFKNKETLEDALWEKECYETLESIEGVTVPRVLYCSKTPEDGTYTLVMRVLGGETLYEKLQKGEQEKIPKVITALANIHSSFPAEKLKPINLEERIRKGTRALNIPDSISNAIAENYNPVALSLNSSAWAWNKDAHPENWIIGETIGVIDCESRNTTPVLCDVVNLLEYADFFTNKQKHEYLEQYIDTYNEKGGTLNKETALQDYHNAVIHRMICFASAWSDSTRPTLHAKRGVALEKGALAINTLREEHAEWYNSHREKYEKLEQALISAAKLMAAYTT